MHNLQTNIQYRMARNILKNMQQAGNITAAEFYHADEYIKAQYMPLLSANSDSYPMDNVVSLLAEKRKREERRQSTWQTSAS